MEGQRSSACPKSLTINQSGLSRQTIDIRNSSESETQVDDLVNRIFRKGTGRVCNNKEKTKPTLKYLKPFNEYSFYERREIENILLEQIIVLLLETKYRFLCQDCEMTLKTRETFKKLAKQRCLIKEQREKE